MFENRWNHEVKRVSKNDWRVYFEYGYWTLKSPIHVYSLLDGLENSYKRHAFGRNKSQGDK